MEEFLTVQEAAKLLGIDDARVRRRIKRGFLEAIVLPHRGKRQEYRIRKSVVENHA